MRPEFLLEVVDLSVTRNYRPIFQPFSFSLKNGESLYLKGKNGAGKTTSLRVLSGASQRYQGTIFLNGDDRKELLHYYAKELIYIGHQLSLNLDLTAWENLSFILSLRGESVSREEALKVFGLLSLPLEDRPVRYFSAGQKRRVILARLWLETRANIWILDEPFTALDVDSIALLEAKMIAHCQNGGAIIFTSHQMPAENVFTKEFTIEGFSRDV
ncbi:cytochrome c biogenesis heme-transporting ATPase CcmA [Ignatzschineria sp. LJL83]